MSELDIFSAALEIEDRGRRDQYLAEACVDNVPLRERIEQLLANAMPDSLLEAPAAGLELSPTIDSPVALRPGDQIGPYKLLQKLGEGGMGVVYMAEQKEPVKRRVALKIVKPGMDSRQVVTRFEAERQAIALMDHPHIARAIDVGTTSHGHPYFVMELVKGVPINEYCDEHRLSTRQRMELIVPICQAVQHAHQKGIIHRDLKPSNILVAEYDNQAVPKIIDFGVAKALNQQLTDKTMFTQLGQVIGTLEYMSPEQAKVNQLDVDTRSDIYSLGVLLYELLTGSTPFDKRRLRDAAWDELVRIIREEEPPIPSLKLSSSETLPSIAAHRHTDAGKLSGMVRGELDWIVMKAMDKERNRRYETASGLALDIQRYLDDEPVLACPSAGYRFRKSARRNKGALVTSGLVAGALLLGLLGTAWQAVRVTQQRNVAVSESARAVQAEEIAQQRFTQAEAARQRESAQRQRAEGAESEANQQRDEALAQQQRADEQAAIAEAVNEFMLKDVFGMADAAEQFTSRIEPDPNVKLTTLLDRALGKVDQRFDDQPQIRAAIQATLGSAFEAIGRYDDAVALWEKARQYYRDALGEEHPVTLTSMNNLAAAYQGVGRYDEAIELLEQTLELQKKVLGPEHPDTLTSMNNLAGAYDDVGRYDEAIQLHEQTLELQKKVLGPEHPDTLTSMHNLAGAYRSAGRYDEAIELQQQTLELKTKVLGPEHPSTLSSMNSLAGAYRNVGRYDEAVELYEQTLELRTKVLGPQHPHTLRSMNNLALAYDSAGRYDDALLLREQTLELMNMVLGSEHPNTLTSMSNLASAYWQQARYDEAIELNEQTLELTTKILGPEHPHTLTSMNNLANTYRSARRYDEAIQLHEQTLELTTKVLGPEHPDTLGSMNNLANDYNSVGRYDEAIQLHELTLELRKKVLGPEHPSTMLSTKNLAFTLAGQGRHKEAAGVYGELLEIQQRVLGPPHQASQTTLHRLIISRDCEAGRWPEAAAALAQLDAGNPLFAYQQALAWLAAGEVENYRRVLGEMRASFADSDEPALRYWLAWTTLLQPIPDDQQEAALVLAQSLIEADAPDHFRLTLAASLLRCGQVEEAIEQLEQLHSEYESAEEKPTRLSPAYLWYFLALARQQQGNDDEAQQWFDRANEWVAKDTTDGQPPVPWNRRLTYELLRAEVKNLMAESTTR